jgi:hypothetical protein
MDMGPYVYIAYYQRGRITHDEVLCRHHFDDMNALGVYSGTQSTGSAIDIKPWKGEPQCSQCDTVDDIRPGQEAQRSAPRD